MPAYFTPSPRVRRSPFFDSTVAEGVTSFSIYNHMYIPTGYGDPMAEYWRLIEGVAMWDVACERQVELHGPDAGKLAQVLCPRKLEYMRPGRGWYVPIWPAVKFMAHCTSGSSSSSASVPCAGSRGRRRAGSSECSRPCGPARISRRSRRSSSWPGTARPSMPRRPSSRRSR